MLDIIKNQLPEVAKDVRLNLEKVLDCQQTDGLTAAHIKGCALAVAYHLGNKILIQELEQFCEDEKLRQGAKLAASLMAMTNIYYRFIHLSEMPELGQIPAGLRMQGMMSPGVDRLVFEVMSLAVSILNGCGACINAHSQKLLQENMALQSLARVGRIAAVIHATHVSMNFA